MSTRRLIVSKTAGTMAPVHAFDPDRTIPEGWEEIHPIDPPSPEPEVPATFSWDPQSRTFFDPATGLALSPEELAKRIHTIP